MREYPLPKGSPQKFFRKYQLGHFIDDLNSRNSTLSRQHPITTNDEEFAMNLHRMLNHESPTRHQEPPLHTPTPRTTQPNLPLLSIEPKKQPQSITDCWGFQGRYGVKGSFASRHTRRKKEGCSIGTCFEVCCVFNLFLPFTI